MNASDAFGLVSQGVLAASAVLAVLSAASKTLRPHLERGTPSAAAAWGVVVVLAVAVRVAPLPLAAYHLRGLVGDPSVVTVVLLALAFLRPAALPPAPRPRVAAVIAVSCAVLLYLPLVTGTFPLGLDFHSLGWGGRAVPLLAALGALGALAWLRGAGRWLAVLSVALLAWGAGLVESDNVLDALVDPGLVVACVAVACRRAP